MPLTDDIGARVRRDFEPAEVSAVLDVLSKLQSEDARLFSPRILRCLLFAAGGSSVALAAAITLARTDYRDLIVSVEYDRDFRQIRDFNQPFENAD
jgi:hypothetical protein